LSAKLSPEERKDIEEKPTDNLEAYDLYLQAKRLLSASYWVLPSSEKEIYAKTIRLLEEATQRDPKFALAYCLMARAHDILYVDGIDRTPERRALGDTAVNEALRLRPDLPEAHLALAAHLYYCYRDFERARVQIAIAGQTLSNNSDLLELAALIDRVQGRWEKSTESLERAISLDPRNVELVGILSDSYGALRRFQDAQRFLDRAIQLQPDQPWLLITRAWSSFSEKADIKGARARCEALLSSTKDPEMVANRVWLALYARDFAAAEEILKSDQNKELPLCRAVVPREIFTLWLEFIQGNHPSIEQFGAAREQLNGKVEGDPTNPFLLTALAWADLALGRKQAAIEEGRYAMELRPISEDAFHGPDVAQWIAVVYALANQPDAAFAQLNILVKIPALHLNYGELKTNPAWDPLRKDPRFDKLLAELAPRD
jgi:tetratricopeptide (TPR) repeat protein